MKASAGVPRKGRPGRELEKLIPNVFKSKGCGCGSYARKMDNWGVDGCRQNLEAIAGRLVSEAAKLKVPKFASVPVAKYWINKAIDNAAQKELADG